MDTDTSHQILPPFHFSTDSSKLPFHPYVFAIRHRGSAKIRTAEGPVACRAQNIALPSRRWQRLRSSPLKMPVSDIHTHAVPDIPGSAVVNIDCNDSAEGEHFTDSAGLYSAGLHPWTLAEDNGKAISLLRSLLSRPEVVAVGECGIDSLRGPSADIQEREFRNQALLSMEFSKPMILHVVRKIDAIISIRKELSPSERWLIHGFRGGVRQMYQLFDLGFDVSFGISPNPDALASVPSDRLFLETDGKCGIGQVQQLAMDLRSCSRQEIERITSHNVQVFLQQSWHVQ